MTATLGLDRLPQPVATLLEEAAANLLAIANELDALVQGDSSSLDEITRIEDTGDRIVHDLIAVVGHSRRLGPDRTRLIELAQDVDDVVDALQVLAWAWSPRPLPELAGLLRALRDAARDAGHAVAATQQQAELRQRLARCREREHEVRQMSRAARAWLLVEQPDPRLAIRGHDVLRQADIAARACTRLRVHLERDALG